MFVVNTFENDTRGWINSIILEDLTIIQQELYGILLKIASPEEAQLTVTNIKLYCLKLNF